MNKRIARLKKNGDEYIVNRIDFRTNTVYTYGEILKYLYKGNIVKKVYYREGVVKFPKSEVEIYEIPKYTIPFLEKLLRQSERNVKPAPAPKLEVSTETLNFINKTINNLNDITFSEFFRPKPPVKRKFPGKVTDEILEKIIENGYTTVIYRSDPENNFIADSYVLALDEKSAREKGVNYDRPITEIGRVYYDEENDIYYRNTGSAD
jgi:hypothetical protein